MGCAFGVATRPFSPYLHTLHIVLIWEAIMPVDSKCAITMPLPELALQVTDVTPTIEGSAAANERARFARARAKADAERSLPRPNAKGETLLQTGNPLEDTSDVAPVVVGSVQTVDLSVSRGPNNVPTERR
jgi:hypothetical protein